MDARESIFAILPWTTAVCLACLQPRQGSGQQPQSVIAIDHRTRLVSVTVQAADTKTFYEWDQIRLPEGLIRVELSNTASALYTCSVGTKVVSDPQLDSVRTFIAAFAPYFGDIVRTGVVSAFSTGDPTPVSGEGKKVLDQLAALDTALIFPHGVRDYREHALAALHAISENHHQETRWPALGPPADQDALRSDSAIVDAFRKWALDPAWANTNASTTDGSLQERSYPYLALTRRTLHAFLTLDTAARNLRAKLPSGSPDTVLPKLLKRADSVLGAADAIVSAVYATQQIAAAVFNNTSTIHCGNAFLRNVNGREIDVTVAARKTPETNRLAERADYLLAVTALPQRTYRPIFGIAALVVPDAVFPTKVAAKSSDSLATSVIVTENGAQDNRGLYAVSLGLGFQFPHDWAVVFPNVVVSPTTDVKAFGVGAALNWRWVSVGVGGVAVQHVDYLTATNTALADPALLQTRTRYGPLKWFYSVALTGIPGVTSSAH